MVRVAVIDYELCHPDKCGIPCIRFCPINKTKPYKAIEISSEKKGKPVVYEDKCIACGICIKKCPFKAIRIVNLPEEIEENLIHRYAQNGFKLYGLPLPIKGKIVGVLGPNGAGKTTAMKILSGSIIPNLGDYASTPSIDRVLDKFKGTVFYDYFKKLYAKELKVVHKIQYIELIPSYIRKGIVREILDRVDERKMKKDVIDILNMELMLDKDITVLSGGELQKLAIAAALLRDGNIYIFDEPSSYLDLRERLNMAVALRELLPKDSYVFIVDHDLMLLDYLADQIVITYGIPGVYGIFSKVYSTNSGIDYYLSGYLPSENMRIRDEAISFRFHEIRKEFIYIEKTSEVLCSWSNLVKKLDNFILIVEHGEAHRGEVIGIVGPNAIGKTTFIRILVGELAPDEGFTTSTALRLSYKPQYLERKIDGCVTVEECLKNINKEALNEDHWLYQEIIKRLGIDRLFKKEIENLSGGELQKFYIAQTLIRDADIYLLDEPSSHIDVEDQLLVARTIKKIARLRKAALFVVDHNFLLIDYAVDRLMTFTGIPTKKGYARSPTAVGKAFNELLKELGLTVRRDKESGRPRINKPGSYLDRYQRELGMFFYYEK